MTHDLQEIVNTLTERINQILDSDSSLTVINMGSKAGRQFVAAVIARGLVLNNSREQEDIISSNAL